MLGASRLSMLPAARCPPKIFLEKLTASRGAGMLRCMSSFATHGLIDDEYELPTEQRLALSVQQPTSVLALTPGQVKNISTARLRYAMLQLAEGSHDLIQQCLRDVAARNPKEAVELYIELLQFSIPKIKAVAVQIDHTSGGKPVKEYSLEELQRIAAGGE